MLITSNEISDIKVKQSVVFNKCKHDDEVSNNHNYIVTIATSVGSLYEYLHQRFRIMREKLRLFACKLNNKLFKITFAMQRDKMMNKLYVELVGSIVLILNHHFIVTYSYYNRIN